MKHTPPFVTLALLVANVAAYAAELSGGGMAVCERWGFTPTHPTLATALMSMWLHDPDHLAHLAANLVTLLVLGLVLEPLLGAWRFAGLFLAAGLGAAASHLLVSPDSVAPLVGMSGCLTGLMAVGAVARPRALLAFTVTFMTYNLVQLLTESGGSVSVAAHTGGFVVGAVFAVVAQARGPMETWRLALG